MAMVIRRRSTSRTGALVGHDDKEEEHEQDWCTSGS